MTRASDVVVQLDKSAWKRGLLVNEKRKPKRGLANTLHVLSAHTAWSGVLAYDDFGECIVKLKPPPVRPQDAVSGETAGEWTEQDSARTAAWFATEIGFEPSTTHVEQAVSAVAERMRIHPVRDYLRGLKWDGVGRVNAMMTRYFGAPANDYTTSVAAAWMVSAVARVQVPGCQADSMPVLEGPQGIGKSTGLEALFGKSWFADTGVAVGEKDSYQALRRKWGYEFGELSSLKGREVERVKAFISARVDTYRPSYARRTRDFPRQVVFCGTTNETEYLADRTGNRRFWPLRCGARIDVEGIRRDRDQLWAEAFHWYGLGTEWHIHEPALRQLCEDEQREREPTDAWLGIVEGWLALPAQASYALKGITTADLLTGAVGMKASDIGRAEETRAGHVLREIGWASKQRREAGERVRRYRPAQPAQRATENGSDTEAASPPPQTVTSLPSQPDLYTHTGDRKDCDSTRSDLGCDGCSVVTDDVERDAIQNEGRVE